MRGDGDEAMEENVNITLLEKIVEDQRKIIEKVTGKKAEQTPRFGHSTKRYKITMTTG